MALPSPGFYTTGDVLITTVQDFGSVQAGVYSTGKTYRLYNDYGSSHGSEDMTSTKITIRGSSGGTDETWVQQHWVQIKSDGGSTGLVDDAQTIFTAVGKNKELSLGDIPSGEYRTLYARCYPPTDATEQDLAFQLRVTYQQPATSICNWITGLRGNGVVASTGDPFAMSTGGSTGTIPYEAGYALIYNNEIYYGSSGTYDISTTGSGTYTIYLNESGAFNETTGSVAANQLELYEATISTGVCTALTDKRVYLAGLQVGTTGAIPATPDLGDLYLDITNGKLYAAKAAGTWTVIVPGATFVSLTDTPANYTGDAGKILTVTTGETTVEFTPSTGIKLDDFGTPDDNTDLDASTGAHGLLLKRTGSTVTYLRADGTWATPTGTTGGAAMTFLDLTDTPSDYSGDASKILVVTTGENAVEFTSSTGIDHNNFGGLDSGDYQHLTQAEHDEVTPWLGSVTLSTGGTIDIPTGQEYQINGAEVKLDDWATPSTGTALDASTGRHGLLIPLDANTSNFLRGDGSWQVPPGVGDVTSSGAFTVGRLTEISTTGGVIKASPFTVTTGDVFDFGAHSAVFTEQAIATTTGTAAINWNNGLKALFTRSTGSAGAVTFSFTAPVKSANLMLITRGSTAGSTGTVTWPAIKWDGGSAPSLGSGASDINVVGFYYSTGLTSYLGQCSTGTFSS